MTGRRFRQIRRAVGLSQSQLAKLLGVWPNTVAHWDRGDKSIPGPVEFAMKLLLEKDEKGENEMEKSKTKKSPVWVSAGRGGRLGILRKALAEGRAQVEQLRGLSSVEELPEKVDEILKTLDPEKVIGQKARAARGVK
jgi:transcriptional regulator with XRE-family HTH domain